MARPESSLPPMPDYSFKAQPVDTGPAQLALQKQAQERQQQQQGLDNTLKTVQMASELAQSFVEMSKARQQKDAIKAYAMFKKKSPQETQVLTAFPDQSGKAIAEEQFPKPVNSLEALAARALGNGQPVPENVVQTKQDMRAPKSLKSVAGKLDDKEAFANYDPDTGKYFDPTTGVDVSGRFIPGGSNTSEARLEISNRVEGDKLSDKLDPTKFRDYDRLTAGKRLDQFVKSTNGKAIRQQVVEASSLLASMLQGGGRGGVVSEKLIQELTPTTMKGTAMEKLQWLTNHPQDVDQKKFLDLFEKTAIRESQAAEDNIRQQQVEVLLRHKHVKRIDPDRYAEILRSTGLDPENIDEASGKFKRTKKTRSLLPEYDVSGQSDASGITIDHDALNAELRKRGL